MLGLPESWPLDATCETDFLLGMACRGEAGEAEADEFAAGLPGVRLKDKRRVRLSGRPELGRLGGFDGRRPGRADASDDVHTEVRRFDTDTGTRSVDAVW